MAIGPGAPPLTVVKSPVAPPGIAAGWAPAHLLDGDELDDQPGHKVPPDHNLRALYKLPDWQTIVRMQGWPLTTAGINAGVIATGGRTLSNGQPVFSSRSVILLPQGGPRAPAAPVTAPGASGSMTPIVIGAIIGKTVTGSLIGMFAGAAAGYLYSRA